MRNGILEYLKALIEKKYGTLEDESGCGLMNEETGEWEWLSISEFVRLIDRADEEYED